MAPNLEQMHGLLAPRTGTPLLRRGRLNAQVIGPTRCRGTPLLRRRRLNTQVVGFDLARLGGRDMGEFGEGVEHHGDAQVAQRHHGRLPDAKILGVDQAEEGEDRARERERCRLLELAFDDEHGDRAQNDAGERCAAAERRQALYKMPVLPSLSKPTVAALVPAAPRAPSIMVLPQAAICGIIARMIAGA